jgi:hypothetical protein
MKTLLLMVSLYETENHLTPPPTLDLLLEYDGCSLMEAFGLKRKYLPMPSVLRWALIKTIYRNTKTLIDLSRVQYVWPGPGQTWPDDAYICDLYHKEDANTMQALYGDSIMFCSAEEAGCQICPFDINLPCDSISSHSWGFVETTWAGWPTNDLIMFVYPFGGFADRVFVGVQSGFVRVMNRKEAEEHIYIQKAYLRLPLDESATDYLLKGLDHENSGIRFRCAEALVKLGRAEGREYLGSMFAGNDAYLRIRAADALARVGDPNAVEYLVQIAVHSEDKYLRIFAEITLREIGRWTATKHQFFTDASWKDWRSPRPVPFPRTLEPCYAPKGEKKDAGIRSTH